MLVTFETTAYRSITMLGDIALKLLKLMGRRGKMPGAILPEDIPAALQRLRSGIAAQEAEAADEPKTDAGDDGEPSKVSLRTRAFPLIEMLEAAVEREAAVMWHDENARKSAGEAE